MVTNLRRPGMWRPSRKIEQLNHHHLRAKGGKSQPDRNAGGAQIGIANVS